MSLARWVCGAWLGCCLTSHAQQDFYVAPGGSDGTNDCREIGSPCASIAHALTQVSANGDTLHVAAGTFTEPELALDGVFHQNLRIQGAGSTSTVLQAHVAAGLATHRVLRVNLATTGTLAGITVRHGRTPGGTSGSGDGGAGGNGGGILVNGSLTLVDVRVVDNQTGPGGDAGPGAFAGGRGGRGGGIYNDGYLSLSNCTVAGNATGPGGVSASLLGGTGGDGSGIHNAGGQLHVVACTIAWNESGAGGEGSSGGAGGRGGLVNAGTAVLLNCTISDNSAGTGGPGTNAVGGAGGEGGGLWNAGSGALSLSNCTVAGNSAGLAGPGSPPGAAGSGGGVFNDGGTVTIGHSLVADNSDGGSGVGTDVQGSLVSEGYVLIESTNGLTLTGDLTGALLEMDPALQPLANYGGPTFTRRLPATSVAVDAGDPFPAGAPDTDQRGSPRVAGDAADLGAFELANTNLFVASDGADTTNECRDAALPCATVAHAVAQVLPGDTVLLGTGVYEVVGLALDRRMALCGVAPEATILQASADFGGGSARVLEVSASTTVSLQRLTVRNGQAPHGGDGLADGEPGGDGAYGGGIFNSGWLTLENCHVVSNCAGRGGEGNGNAGSGGSGGGGGGIYNEGTLFLTNCLVAGNRAGSGGEAGEGGSPGEAGAGGAIYNDGELTVRFSALTNNEAGVGGTATDDTAAAGGDGGAVLNNETILLWDTELSGNRAGQGGEGSTGGAGGKGGALFNDGIAVLRYCTVADNGAGLGGTGSVTDGDGGDGAGIASQGDLNLFHVTLNGNAADGSGGALWSASSASLSNVTVAGNAAERGGGVFAEAEGVVAWHTVIGDNVGAGGGPDVWGPIESQGYILLEQTNDAIVAGDETGNLYGLDPQLGALSDYGGPTRTVALLPGSPAIDAGQPGFSTHPAVDQRGDPRVEGGRIDLGAFEFPNMDDDGDGMPDDWELLYGLDPNDDGATNVLTGPMGDPDLDGFDNLSEYIAFTHPALSSSFFRVLAVAPGDPITVRFEGTTGRLYTLRYATDILMPAWNNVASQVDVPGVAGTNVLEDVPGSTNRHYRLEVRLPDG